MNAQETLLNRRSIRKYLKDQVPLELIKKIMTAAIWSPSGSNAQPWRFYVAMGAMRDKLIEALIKASGPHSPSPEAYEEIAIRVEKTVEERMKQDDSVETRLLNMGEEAGKFVTFGSLRFYMAPVIIIVAAPKQMGGSLSLSIGAAVQNLLLAAHAEGLATCWLGMPLRLKDEIIDILKVPDEEVLITSVCLGYPDADSPINNMARSRLPFDETVHILS